MTDPTPVPWNVFHDKDSFVVLDSNNHHIICELPENSVNHVNAAFLVEAVNTYAQHKEVIKDLLEAGEMVCTHPALNEGTLSYTKIPRSLILRIKDLEEAIQKAQELQPRGE